MDRRLINGIVVGFVILFFPIITFAVVSVDYGPNWELPHSDDFSDQSSGWQVGEFVGGSLAYEDGVYAVISSGSEYNMWGLAYQTFGDIEIQVQTQQISAPSNDNNAYGVACRVGRGLRGYFFFISGDGFFSIIRADGENSSALIPFTKSASIRKGNNRNDIRAICKGEELSLYVNGELMASAQDGTFSSGDVALTAISYEDQGTEVHFDNLEVKLP